MPVDAEAGALTDDSVLCRIPAFPPVVLRVLDLLARQETDMAVLVREISSDATLSAQVLRLANSPLFGLATQVDTVHHAVVTLGFSRVQSLVMAVATTNYMKGAMRTEALQLCWRHTLASAVLCRELARGTGMDPDRAYSLGLLHDIGRLGLLVAYPDAYDAVFKAADRDSVSLLDLEKKRFGMDHCETGRRLVEQWKLPQEFWVVAGRHHDPPSGSQVEFLTLVHAACRLADTFGYAVVTPLREASFEEICSVLPAGVGDQFAGRPEMLMEILNGIIDPDHSLSHRSLMERIGTLPERLTAHASAVQDSAERSETGELFANLDSSPAAWEFPALLFTALVMLAGLATACYFWNG